MVPSREIREGGPRLLEVDNRTPLPYNVVVRAIIRSADVLHSWALPSLGVKVDACPEQAFFWQPSNIVNMRGRANTPPALAGDLWEGIRCDQIEPTDPRIKWFIVSVPCTYLENTR